MKKNINLLITLFIVSTLLVAAEPLGKKTKPLDKSKSTQINKVKPTKEKGSTTNIVKPMKKRRKKPSEIQDELELLMENFEAEKLLINDDYKKNLKMLKNRKNQALKALKLDYKKKRAHLRKKN